jgi:hypothetical protein
MNHSIIFVTFEREEDLLQAAEKARREGFVIRDIYSPYPVHGTDRALGLRRSRLPRAAFVFGLLGVALAFWFQFWVSAIDWPINIGGRPWNSLPAFVPVAFEMMVLCSGLGLALTWLFACRLYPGKKPLQPSDRVTDDRFVLEISTAQQDVPATGDTEVIRRLFQDCNVCAVEERGL